MTAPPPSSPSSSSLRGPCARLLTVRGTRMISAGGEEEAPSVSIDALPAALLACVLRRVTQDVSEFVRLALVCRAWRDAVLGGKHAGWTQLRTLHLAAPGGRCPYVLAPQLEALTVTADSGLECGNELCALRGAPLRRLRLLGLKALAPQPLLALCSPLLLELDVSGSRVDGEALAAALRACPALSELAADGCLLRRHTHAALLRELCAHGRCLTRLSLRGAGICVDAAALDAVARASPLLRHLDVSGAESLACIPVAVLELRSLCALHCENTGLSDDALAAALEASQPCLPSLTALSIAGCRGLRSAGIRALAAALRQRSDAPPMTLLRVANLLDLSNDAATDLLRATTRRGGRDAPRGPLALDVSCCGRLGEPFFTECCAVSLLELCVSGLPLLSAPMLSSLASSGALHGLTVLELADCERLQPRLGRNAASEAIAAAASAAGSALRRLVLDACALDDAAAAAIAAACPSLSSLSLVGVTGITDASLKMLAASCTSLHTLAIGGTRARWAPASIGAFRDLRALRLMRCSKLDDDSLPAAVRCSPGLRSLTLAAGGGVTDAGLAKLACAAPHLRELALHAEDHPALRGESLRLFTRLRELTLHGCPFIIVDGVVRLLVACPQLLLLCLPLDLHLALAQRTPVRVVPEAAPDSRAWRPPPLLRLDVR